MNVNRFLLLVVTFFVFALVVGCSVEVRWGSEDRGLVEGAFVVPDFTGLSFYPNEFQEVWPGLTDHDLTIDFEPMVQTETEDGAVSIMHAITFNEKSPCLDKGMVAIGVFSPYPVCGVDIGGVEYCDIILKGYAGTYTLYIIQIPDKAFAEIYNTGIMVLLDARWR